MGAFNKKGDKGTTSLMFGHRVSKHSARPEAYGVLDEASSALGLARGFISDPELKRIVLSIQEDLFIMGSELASLPDEASKLKTRMGEAHTDKLEELIDKYEKSASIQKQFVPPGGSPASGALDLARSIVRRAERRIAGLADQGEINNPFLQSYCNRLADLLFTLARHIDTA